MIQQNYASKSCSIAYTSFKLLISMALLMFAYFIVLNQFQLAINLLF
jgi:hypothetical protein